MKAVGVHIFAGGFSLGVEQHFTLVGHLETGKFGVATWSANRPGIPVRVDPRARWDETVAGLAGRVDLVYGNPPCGGFSRLNANGRGPGSPLNAGIAQVVHTGARLGARIIVVESVQQALTDGHPFFQPLYEEVRSRYPGQVWLLVNTFNHGVCQWRPRVFWILGSELFEVKPTVTEPSCLLKALAGIPPDAPNQEPLEDVLDTPDLAAVIPDLPPGGTPHDIPDIVREKAPRVLRLRQWTRFAMHWPTRLLVDEPGRVITSKPMLVHPTEGRLLTARECARLMGYPDGFRLVGGKRTWMPQLAKGVCPPAGAWLAGEVAAYLRGERPGLGPGARVITVGRDVRPRGWCGCHGALSAQVELF